MPVTTDPALAPFRAVQKLAYTCTQEVAAQLEPGMSEKQAAAMLDRSLKAKGVKEYFHAPFAWFGDRSAFTGFRTALDFMPTDRRIEVGMPAILDVAPIVDRYPADIGYSFRLGDNPAHDAAKRHLQDVRRLILELVLQERTLQDVYRAVSTWADDLGYESCHKKYPYAVLAHRIERLPLSPIPNLKLLGFGLPTLAVLVGKQIQANLPGSKTRLPIWNGDRACAVRPEPGLWAVEPHIGKNGLGAKWEEMLVVTDASAFWLDDDLPHVRGA